MRRRENVEKHKQELLLKTKAPGMVIDKNGDNKRKQRQLQTEAAAASAFQFKAEDPVRVAAKLAKMQRAFEVRQEAKARLAEERRAAKTLQSSASSPVCSLPSTAQSPGARGLCQPRNDGYDPRGTGRFAP
jgi:hypothetical protein